MTEQPRSQEAALREAVEVVLPRLDHWPKNAPGVGWNTLTEPHSAMCPPCILVAALASTPPEDPDAD